MRGFVARRYGDATHALRPGPFGPDWCACLAVGVCADLEPVVLSVAEEGGGHG